MSKPIDHSINGIQVHCNILLNDNKSIPQTVFTNNKRLLKEINPISCHCPVHHGTFLMFSLINFVAVSAEKSSSLHTIIYSKTKHKQSNLLPSNTIEYIFPFTRIRYFILLAINTHIDCSNNSKCCVWCILKATARSLESVSLSIFC